MDVPIQGGLTAHQEQAVSAKLTSAHQTPAAAPRGHAWTPAMGLTAAARAESWLGMPYSWAGGNASGPTLGQCEPGTGGDLDCQIVGFDCSGLAMYAWGAYASLPHLAAAQQAAGGFRPSVPQLLPGDLVFFSGYLAGGTGHVAIYVGKGMVVEAPQSGSVVRRSALAELIATDGYRGAVRPLTARPAPMPTLTAPRTAVPLAGGTVTLLGTHLADVTAVHVGDVTVQQFLRHSDSAIVFRAPAHRSGTAAVTVSTSSSATSRPVNLTYARPRHTSPVATPKPSGPSVEPVAPVPPRTTKPSPPSAPVTTPPAPVKPTPPASGPTPGSGSTPGSPGSGSTTSPPTGPPHAGSTSSPPAA